jgi:hypothetical protein
VPDRHPAQLPNWASHAPNCKQNQSPTMQRIIAGEHTDSASPTRHTFRIASPETPGSPTLLVHIHYGVRRSRATMQLFVCMKRGTIAVDRWTNAGETSVAPAAQLVTSVPLSLVRAPLSFTVHPFANNKQSLRRTSFVQYLLWLVVQRAFEAPRRQLKEG